MSRGTTLLKIGPHYYFDTALRTFCLKRLEALEGTEDHPATCGPCDSVMAVYMREQLLPEGFRCRGRTRGGYRCQRDGIYNGYCPSHLDQDPERTHLHQATQTPGIEPAPHEREGILA